MILMIVDGPLPDAAQARQPSLLAQGILPQPKTQPMIEDQTTRFRLRLAGQRREAGDQDRMESNLDILSRQHALLGWFAIPNGRNFPEAFANRRDPVLFRQRKPGR